MADSDLRCDLIVPEPRQNTPKEATALFPSIRAVTSVLPR